MRQKVLNLNSISQIDSSPDQQTSFLSTKERASKAHRGYLLRKTRLSERSQSPKSNSKQIYDCITLQQQQHAAAKDDTDYGLV